ncbi:MAG: hypothetical protein AB1521_11225 [Bacteroidota bacterium]
MGFSTLIDILGSMIVGGMLLLILFRLNDAAIENTFNYGGDLIVQQNLVEVVQLLEYDFRKIGYCKDWEKIPNPTTAILSADSTSINFLTDVDSDENVDTVHYYLGSRDSLTSTPNPNDRILYRVVNHDAPAGANLGVTQFRLLYFDALGDTIHFPITVPGQIHTMQINITIESTVAYDNKYSSVFWRQIRLAARNLNNR